MRLQPAVNDFGDNARVASELGVRALVSFDLR
jgi:hypothetical protein